MSISSNIKTPGNTFLMGIDIGTQNTKAIIATVDGETIASGIAGYSVMHPQPLWAEQRPEVWLEAVGKVIKETIEEAEIPPEMIAAIAISSLDGSGIPVDEKIKPVRPCILWMDRRSAEEVNSIKKNIAIDELFKVTGNYLDAYFGFSKILWIKDKEPRNWGKIYKIIPPSSYIIYKLTGELLIDYASAGNQGGFFDIQKKEWNEKLASSLGIPLEFMPEKLVKPGEIAGEITKEGSDLTGLEEGTLVITGGVDAPVATLSMGALEEGTHVAMMGTSTCWGFIHEGQYLTKEFVSMPYVAYPETKIYSWGGSATSGALVRWFRDELGAIEVERAAKLQLDPFALLDMKAKKIPPGSEGLILLPYFMGERAPLWDQKARGLISGLTLYHTKAHLFRAFLEAGAYALRHTIETAENTRVPLTEECLVTGGVAASDLWLQILADVTGRPLVTISGDGGAPLGDAFLAGIGANLITDYKKISEWVNYEEPVHPDREKSELYTEYFQEYLEMYENIKANLHKLADLGIRHKKHNSG